MNTKQLIEQLIDRLTHYRKKHVIIADVHAKYELEKRIEDLETKIKFLRELPLEKRDEISHQELERLLNSLPLNFNEFELQKFDNACKIFIQNSKNLFVGNTFTGDNINIDIGDKHYHHEPKIIKSILTKLPYNEAFEGRKKELAELKQQITTHKSISVISINGIGGIGKSALSKAFFLENYKEYDFALFLEGKSTIYDTFNDYTLLDNLEIAEKINSIPYQTPNRNEIVFDIIKNTLSNLEGKKLLLINDASENTHLLKDLIQSDWEILTTSRQKIDFMYSFELKEANQSDAIAIFCVYYGKAIETLSQEEKAQIQRLVNRLALHPLAIELVAKNIKRKDWTFEETNQKLAEKGLNIDEKTNLTTTHTQEKIKDIFEYLLQLFPLENLTEEQLKLLTIYSVLPNLPVTKQTWKTLLGETEDHWQELSTQLNERGLINRNEKAFEIHALLAEIVRYKNEERLDDDCEGMIVSLINELHPEENSNYHKENYKYALLYSSYAKSIVNYIKDNYEKAILYARSGDFYKEIGNLNQAFIMNEKSHFLFLYFIKENPTDISFYVELATSYLKLGEIYKELGNLCAALESFKKAMDSFEQLNIKFSKNVHLTKALAITYEKVGQIYKDLGNLKLALEFFEKQTELSIQLCNTFPQNTHFEHTLAIAYCKMGEIYQILGVINVSLDFFKKQTKIIKELYYKFPKSINFKNGLAISYEKLGGVHIILGNLNIALDFFEKRKELGEQLYNNFPKNISFKHGLAVSYEKLGQIYQKLGNLKLALEFFKKYNNLEKQLYTEFNSNINYKNELAASYFELGDVHQQLGNFKTALEFFKTDLELQQQLYNEFPNNVNFKNGLAISYSKLGSCFELNNDVSKAKYYYLETKKHYVELTEKSPNNAEFQNNLAWVENKLNQLQ